jgi:hypothetical protein
MVRFTCIILNTLHKGYKDNSNDDDDDDDNNTCDWKLLKIIAENIPIKPKTGNARSVAYLGADSD